MNWFELILTADHPAGELSRGIEFGIARALHTMRQLTVKQLDYVGGKYLVDLQKRSASWVSGPESGKP